MHIYLIRSLTQKDDETGEPLWWSNEGGWCYLGDAVVFTEGDKQIYGLPMEGEWVEFYHG